MTKGVGQALEQALAYWRAPALLAAARQRPLPDDVLEVVRIAAGDRASAEFAAAALGVRIEDLAEAAPFYLQQLLFAPGAGSYRVLGVNPDAPDARIKEHYRWLVRWLHPDRNADEWEALYADRVNRAWQDLRNPEKRVAYDASLLSGDSKIVASGTSGASTQFAGGRISGNNPRLPPVEAPMLSGRAAQRLPVIVLGSFGLLAGAALTLMWYARNPPLQHAAEAKVAIAAERAEPSSGLATEVTELARLAVAIVEPEAPPAIPAPAAPPPPTPIPPPVGAPSGAKAPSPQTTPIAATTPRVAPQPAALIAVAAPTETVGPESPPTDQKQTPTPTPAVLVASAPEPAAAAQPAPAAAPAPITEPEALAVLDRFTAAYAAGDLRELMHLFTRDATNNRGGRTEIAYDYQELFDDSETREIRLKPNGWLQGEDSATLLARFEVRLSRHGQWLPARSVGDIRFDLAREDGQVRIRNIVHEER